MQMAETDGLYTSTTERNSGFSNLSRISARNIPAKKAGNPKTSFLAPRKTKSFEKTKHQQRPTMSWIKIAVMATAPALARW